MNKFFSLISAVVIALSFSSLALADDGFQGIARIFVPQIGVATACFDSNNYGGYAAAVGKLFLNDGRNCGKVLSVGCVGAVSDSDLMPFPCTENGSVNVTIIDVCLSCDSNGLLLSQDAFNTIANTITGHIRVAYIFASL